jgi:hypothetical protein
VLPIQWLLNADEERAITQYPHRARERVAPRFVIRRRRTKTAELVIHEHRRQMR